MSNRNLIRVSVCFCLFVVFSAVSPAAAEGNLTKVSGKVTSILYTTNCPSPVQVCGTGPITGSLNGTLTAIAQSINPVTRNGNVVAVTFNGTGTITTTTGTLAFTIFDYQQLSTMNQKVVITITGGTGAFASTFGWIYMVTDPNAPQDGNEHFTYKGILITKEHTH